MFHSQPSGFVAATVRFRSPRGGVVAAIPRRWTLQPARRLRSRDGSSCTACATASWSQHSISLSLIARAAASWLRLENVKSHSPCSDLIAATKRLLAFGPVRRRCSRDPLGTTFTFTPARRLGSCDLTDRLGRLCSRRDGLMIATSRRHLQPARWLHNRDGKPHVTTYSPHIGFVGVTSKCDVLQPSRWLR